MTRRNSRGVRIADRVRRSVGFGPQCRPYNADWFEALQIVLTNHVSKRYKTRIPARSHGQSGAAPPAGPRLLTALIQSGKTFAPSAAASFAFAGLGSERRSFSIPPPAIVKALRCPAASES